MNLHAEMESAAAETARVVGGVRADQYSAATPCTDWDLRTLLNHTILWTAYSAELRARDEPLPEEMMSRDFVAEPGYAAAYAAQIDKAMAAWSDPAAWERDLNVMGTPTPAAAVAALLLAETVLHGWDVAKASGQEYSCTEPVAAAVLAAVEANAELFRKYQGFADPVPIREPAPVSDRALAVSGRDPAWTPPT
ncbi:MAG TPA: TIGR03086 family metal-binding protein [Streptosporangiaceae bacterium]|nr:TIGR03086 family metal-binding protein [Streptosporangiaceae bacterium]